MLSDTYDAPIPHLRGLPSAPSISKDIDGSTFKTEDLLLCAQEGTTPHQVLTRYLTRFIKIVLKLPLFYLKIFNLL